MRYCAHLTDDFVGNLSGRPREIARLFVRFGKQVCDAAQHHFKRRHALHGRLVKIPSDTALFRVARVKQLLGKPAQFGLPFRALGNVFGRPNHPQGFS